MTDSIKKEKLVLVYDLLELPTAQHKAGLAGLLMMIRSMKRRKVAPIPHIKDLTSTSVEISFTQESMQALFDDLYRASWVEVESKKKWANKKPKRTIRKKVQDSRKDEEEDFFVYDTLQPVGDFLRIYFPDGDGKWLSLWREATLRTIRSRPTQKFVYTETADGKNSSEASRIWDNLKKAEQKRNAGKDLVENISSSLFIGAQDRTRINHMKREGFSPCFA